MLESSRAKSNGYGLGSGEAEPSLGMNECHFLNKKPRTLEYNPDSKPIYLLRIEPLLSELHLVYSGHYGQGRTTVVSYAMKLLIF